jgi:hypothetical protein
MQLNDIAKQIKESPSDIARALDGLGLSLNLVTNAHFSEIKSYLSPAPIALAKQSKSAGAIAPVSGEQQPVSMNTAAAVSQRRTNATTQVLANASNQVSSILEEAAALAQENLQEKKSGTVQRLAGQMVASAEAEIDAAMGFFEKYMSQSGGMAIADYQQTLVVDVIE